ncbi:hypothetical protein [Streptomyces zhihengii]|uniref:Uncharacterized protein n=1 Tax=Streptomyces zhihengii TaxID=1818004 RepID=A0ABS2V3Y1_9ACTN|nr:hypothetical protein [Streptomyces zhihengii]MBM9624541.1 hypothetical protein [Streptomyces zhihengii]
MISAADRYRQEWATKTGRNPVDVYVPAALLKEKGQEVGSLHEMRTRQRMPMKLALLSSARVAA